MTFTKPVTEIIKQRFSCRSYLNHPIKKETRQLLAEYAASVKTGPFGTQARFELVAATEQDRIALKNLGTYGFIKGASGFIIGATEVVGTHLEDFGYLMERVILFATDIGLGTCWLGGTFTKSSFAKKISASSSELIPAVTSVGYIAKTPRRVDSMIRRGAGSDRRLPWERLFFDSRFGVPIPREAAGDYVVPLEMVRLSPSASNQQPWRIIKDGNVWHFYLHRTPGYLDRRLVKLFTVADLQRIDMGIAMSHFELAARELGLEGYWEMNEPRIEKPDDLTEFTISWVSVTARKC